MTIAIQTSKADRVRLLAQRHPYLTPRDITATTGIPLDEVRAALKRRRKDKPKSRIVGP